MQRLLDFLATVTKAGAAKLKRLAIHIIKHPLGSIWWAVKMYFSLMFLSLFVACSFGAFASNCPVGSTATEDGLYCEAPAPSARLWRASVTHGAETKTFSRKELKDAQMDACNWFLSASQSETTSGFRTCTGGRSFQYKECNYVVKDGKTVCDFTGSWKYSNVNGSDWQGDSAQFYCPPDNPALGQLNILHKPSAISAYCRMPKPYECFKESKYLLANQFHFAPEDAGKGSVCVLSDNPDGQKCRWKELDGSKGAFVPDPDSTESCSDIPPSDPIPDPPEPPECTTTKSGMKLCKKDPNEHCTANSSNAMSCPPSCGFINNTDFVCFENPPEEPPEEPEEPEEPDTPRPPKNDDIENPDKPLQDMLKKDFKDVQRGVESRLDGFAADMANLIKAEKGGNEQLVKNTAQGNKLLNSINQNTADTVKELKKLSEPGDKVEGIEKPEFEENKNDWKVRNFGTVMKSKGDEIMKLPLMQAIDDFFDVSFSGSCPTYSVSVWVFEINIDQFCDQQVQSLFPYIKAVVLLMCSFFAIRIALL